MRIFVSFGFNDRDRWVKDLVYPIVKAFGHEVVTGEDLAGQPINQGVSARIDASRALIAFVTRRDGTGGATGLTHRWVTDELAYAIARHLLVLEVREEGVDSQGGMAGNLQHIAYDEARREICLVEIVAAVGAWPRGQYRLQLIGNNIEQLIPLMRRAGFTCSYRFNVDGDEREPVPTRLQPIKGGLFIDVKDVPPSALIQVEIEDGTSVWSSGYESLDSNTIRVIQG